MDKMTRNSRVVAITKILMEKPNKIIGLNKFSELLNAAKSTISEDIVIVRETLQRLQMGKVETISGAAGGIKFIPEIGKEKVKEFALELCELLKDDGRVIAGNFIYMTDLMYNPDIIRKAAVVSRKGSKQTENEKGRISAGDKVELIRVSVRNLVEFILRSGDIDNRRGTMADKDAMQQGSRIHRKIQRQMGAEYRAEVALKYEVPCLQHDKLLPHCEAVHLRFQRPESEFPSLLP